jgi:hypothetical protein
MLIPIPFQVLSYGGKAQIILSIEVYHVDIFLYTYLELTYRKASPGAPTHR